MKYRSSNCKCTHLVSYSIVHQSFALFKLTYLFLLIIDTMAYIFNAACKLQLKDKTPPKKNPDSLLIRLVVFMNSNRYLVTS